MKKYKNRAYHLFIIVEWIIIDNRFILLEKWMSISCGMCNKFCTDSQPPQRCIYASLNRISIGSDNGLSPSQAII